MAAPTFGFCLDSVFRASCSSVGSQMVPHSQLGEVRTSNCAQERAAAQHTPAHTHRARSRVRRALPSAPTYRSGALPEQMTVSR